MWTRAGLKNRAKEVVRANYWKTVLAALILSLIAGGLYGAGGARNSSSFMEGTGDYGSYHFFGEMGISPIFAAMAVGVILVVVLIIIAVALVVNIFLINPLVVGIRRFFYTNLHEKAEIRELAFSFDHSYKNAVKTMFFRDLYTCLWSLLFVIPGIVKSYEYRMIPYLLAQYPDMPMEQAFETSRRLMDGNKWKAFVLDLSFILWFFLSGITGGLVGLFYVQPYFEQTAAALYDAITIERPVFGGMGPGSGSSFQTWNGQQASQGYQGYQGYGQNPGSQAMDAGYTPVGNDPQQNKTPSGETNETQG